MLEKNHAENKLKSQFLSERKVMFIVHPSVYFSLLIIECFSRTGLV